MTRPLRHASSNNDTIVDAADAENKHLQTASSNPESTTREDDATKSAAAASASYDASATMTIIKRPFFHGAKAEQQDDANNNVATNTDHHTLSKNSDFVSVLSDNNKAKSLSGHLPHQTIATTTSSLDPQPDKEMKEKKVVNHDDFVPRDQTISMRECDPSLPPHQHQQQQEEEENVKYLLVPPPLLGDDDDHPVTNNTTLTRSPDVRPGAVAVRGMMAMGGGASSSSTLSLMQDDDDNDQGDHDGGVNHDPSLTSSSDFVVANVVTEEDIRRQYLSEVRDEILGEPVKAVALDDEKHSPCGGVWSCVGIVTILVVIVIVVVVVVVVTRNKTSHSNASSVQTCAMMTNLLRDNFTNVSALQNQIAPMCDHSNDGGETYCTYNVGSDLARNAQAQCTHLGGTWVQENFTIACNYSSTGNNSTYNSFLHYSVCVGATCNASQVLSYLEDPINSQQQVLEEQVGHPSCHAVYGTYDRFQGNNSSNTFEQQPQQQQEQQVQFLPSLWGEQCAAELDAITANTSLTKLYPTTVFPSCQRNATSAICTLDFTTTTTPNDNVAAATLLCARLGGQVLEHDVTFQCTSTHGSDGGTYTFESLHQPLCTGVHCNLNQVDQYTVDTIRSSLVDQGFQNCQLLSSQWRNPANVSMKMKGDTCATETNAIASTSSMAALYRQVTSASANSVPTSQSCQDRNLDFSALVPKAQSACAQLGGNYSEQDFTIKCNAVSNNSSCSFTFSHVFLCSGLSCTVSQVESYLEWPLVSQPYLLERGGYLQNCRVAYGSYQTESGPVDYLRSIWGEQCASENNNLVAQGTLATTLSSSAVILPTCQSQGGGKANCTSDYGSANIQVESLCHSLNGQYFEIDYSFTCSSQVGPATIGISAVHEPHCTGTSCNVNQSYSYALELANLNLESQGLHNCSLLDANVRNEAFVNASAQQLNTSKQSCSWETNDLSINSRWARLNSYAAAISPTCHYINANFASCGYDYGPFVSQAATLCNELGGQYIELNFTAVNCSQNGFTVTYDYAHDFFCFGQSCTLNQTTLYREGIILLELLRNNCSSVA